MRFFSLLRRQTVKGVSMRFISTRNPKNSVSFRESLFKGLAPDGGLFTPETYPDLSSLMRDFTPDKSFVEIASALTASLFPEELSHEQAERICRRAFTFQPAIVPYNDAIAILELFHGPTCAFKDFGASFLASAMEEFLEGESQKAVILTATSGDTGSAVAAAFAGRRNIDVVILYPKGRVSPLQEKQLTTVGGNVRALEVRGSFDDCQRMVKEAFTDRELEGRLRLTSANSINSGRLIPQAFYYVWAWVQMRDTANDIFFCVPSGNFGNLTAGILAWRWGMPVHGFIAATNANDVVPEYLKTGIFTPRPSVATLSNAMDVGNPSNFERLLHIFGKDRELMQKAIHGEVVNDEETRDKILRVYKKTGMFIDPHTAVGLLASERSATRLEGRDCTIISLATAHPGKFLEVVEDVTGKKQELPERLRSVLAKEKQATEIGNKTADLKAYLLDWA